MHFIFNLHEYPSAIYSWILIICRIEKKTPVIFMKTVSITYTKSCYVFFFIIYRILFMNTPFSLNWSEQYHDSWNTIYWQLNAENKTDVDAQTGTRRRSYEFSIYALSYNWTVELRGNYRLAYKPHEVKLNQPNRGKVWQALLENLALPSSTQRHRLMVAV